MGYGRIIGFYYRSESREVYTDGKTPDYVNWSSAVGPSGKVAAAWAKIRKGI